RAVEYVCHQHFKYKISNRFSRYLKWRQIPFGGGVVVACGLLSERPGGREGGYMPTTARRILAVSFCFAVVSLSGCSGEIDNGAGADRTEAEFSLVSKHPHKRVCDAPTVLGLYACHARIRVAYVGRGIVPY